MDPPYYQNVMYAELSDFFYVWLKRTAGLLYPDLFQLHLTDKDREAVANLRTFSGKRAGQRISPGRLPEPDGRHLQRTAPGAEAEGVMTVMFTHKEADAWDALAEGLIEAGFIITASWPVNTEAEGSLHIRESPPHGQRSFWFALARNKHPETRYWEDTEPQVRQAVRAKSSSFKTPGSAASICTWPVSAQHFKSLLRRGR